MANLGYIPFHLAIPVNDLETARIFYGRILGLDQTRESKGQWIDYNFYGHQVVCHFTYKDFKPIDYDKNVENHGTPVPHFGVCLSFSEWNRVKEKLITESI
jgi:extradiol dioxygenase family protein